VLDDVGILAQSRGESQSQGRAVVPDVSFLIAAYNVAPFIEDAVRSALDQVGVSVEVIVIDDASSDGTAAVVETMAAVDPRVVLIKVPKNEGPGAARNKGLMQARGKWVAVLDGDDLIEPGRTQSLLNSANATGADIVGDNFERITFEGTPTGKFLFRSASVPFLFQVDAATFITTNEIFGSAKLSLGAVKVMIRSEFLRAKAVLHPEDLPVGEDFRFILSCLFRGAKFVVTSESGYKYRLRPGSQSWRLTDEHMARLICAADAISAEVHESGSAAAKSALAQYKQTTLRMADFVRAVTLAKGGLWNQALAAILFRPQTWPLAARFGTEAIIKRLKRN
jgi:succinoglycan biosynthesis protein ExoO